MSCRLVLAITACISLKFYKYNVDNHEPKLFTLGPRVVSRMFIFHVTLAGYYCDDN